MTADGIDIASMTGGLVRLGADHVADLRAAFQDRMLGPDDPDWAAAIQPWNGMVAKVPALVLQPTSAREVATAVSFARAHGLLLSVRGGGHNIAGTSIAQEGLTLDLSRMRQVEVDPQARRAHAGAGARLGDVDRATQEHGLAVPLGFVSVVGVGGLTLGGGIGYLTRRFGYTVDNLAEVEIVTADGTIRRASQAENSELFWAIRGGGGNFGVVTRFTFDLHEVGPTVYGGVIAWPFEQADEILRSYREFSSTAPRELSVWLLLVNAPPAPFVPDHWHGKPICMMVVCYSGDLDQVDKALQPIWALPDPIADALDYRPYTQLQSLFDDAEPAGFHYYWTSGYVRSLVDDHLRLQQELFAEAPFPGVELGFLHLGGALGDRAEDDGAVGNREARYITGIFGTWAADDPGETSYIQWIRDSWKRLRLTTTGRTYVNFQLGDENVRDSYGANLERLASVKRAYDPDNFFRLNRNIPPG